MIQIGHAIIPKYKHFYNRYKNGHPVCYTALQLWPLRYERGKVVRALKASRHSEMDMNAIQEVMSVIIIITIVIIIIIIIINIVIIL